MRRTLMILMLLAFILGAMAPAAAKMPQFDLSARTDGLTVTLTATLRDTSWSTPAPAADGAALEDPIAPGLSSMVAVVPSSVVGPGGTIRSDERRAIAPTFEPVARGVYQAIIELPHPGSWTTVVFPGNEPPPAGMFGTVSFDVGDVEGDKAAVGETGGAINPTAVVAALTVATALVVARLRPAVRPSRGGAPAAD